MNVLIAEDDSLISFNISQLLKNSGYQVLGPAQSGAESLALLQDHKVDLAILDLNLSDDIDGIEIAKAVKSQNPEIPILFITGQLENELRIQAKQVGANAFLNKPFHERNLLNAIELALDNAQIPKSSGEELESEHVKAAEKNIIYIKKNEHYLKIDLQELLFIEASGHYIVLNLLNNQVLASSNMSNFLQGVNNPKLVRVHRSFAVNIEHVNDFDDSFIYFKNKNVPISRNYKSELKKRLPLL